MTPFRARVLTAALLCRVSVVTASAQVSPSDSARFVAITQDMLDAITNGDSAEWSPHLSARWTLTDEEGRRIGREERTP